MPEYCGGPQIQCMAQFVAVPQSGGRGKGRGNGRGRGHVGDGDLPPSRGRGRGRPRGGASGSSQGGAPATPRDEDGDGEDGEGGGGEEGRGRAQLYWREEWHGMRLMLVILSDDLYPLFIHKDFRLDKNQLNSKRTDNQEFWDLVAKRFGDASFVPNTSLYAGNKHLDQEW
eukprot:2365969-Rhodomonas_salina.1